MSDPSGVRCENFTDVVRRPLMVGKVHDLHLPFVASLPQVGVAFACLVLLFLSAHFVWGRWVPPAMRYVLYLMLPLVAGRQVTHSQLEGRPIERTLVAYVWFLCSRRWSNDAVVDTPNLVDVPLPAVKERTPRP